MATYNSLVVDAGSCFTSDWRVTAHSEDGEIWGLDYRPAGKAWAFGVQFHPESFLSRGCEVLRDNWLYHAQAVTLSCPGRNEV
jgi:anthranilate/para-aminobenzoate synthase component II